MKMRLRNALWLCLVGIFVFEHMPAQGHILKEEEVRSKTYLTKKQALDKAFSDADQVTIEKKWLDKTQKKSIQDLTGQPFNQKRVKLHVGIKDGKKIGLAHFDRVVNLAHHPLDIHYMVVCGPDGRIKRVEILEFKGLQRDELVSEAFLGQFIGKSAESDFLSVASSAGSSASVQALCQGIRKSATIIKTVYSD